MTNDSQRERFAAALIDRLVEDAMTAAELACRTRRNGVIVSGYVSPHVGNDGVEAHVQITVTLQDGREETFSVFFRPGVLPSRMQEAIKEKLNPILAGVPWQAHSSS